MTRALLAPPLFTLATLASIATVGCGHTEAYEAILRAPPPPTGHTVELYVADMAPPARPFYDVALVQAVGFGSDANPEDVARALTTRAATLGCDAVVKVFIDVGYSRANASGVCVRYLDAPPAGWTAPAPQLPPAPPSNPTPPPRTPSPAPTIERLPSAPNQGR